MTAVNDEGGQINVARDQSGEEDTIPRTMQKYQSRSEPWMLVVDDNCGSNTPSLALAFLGLANEFRWRGIGTRTCRSSA
jgi:hypothetical protein